MRALVLIGAVGAGAYFLHKRGMFPQFGAVADAVDDLAGGFMRRASFVPPEEYDAPARAKDAYNQQVKEASGGAVVPLLGKEEVTTTNKYEAALRAHWAEVSPWARRNIGWAAAILKTENAPLDPKLAGDNGTSFGVGQVKVATAETVYRAGYSGRSPTRAELETLAGGIYFATAEMDRLSGINSNLDWIIQAYNGGAGFEKMGEKYKRDRAAYLAKVKRNFVSLYGKGVSA